ncbi:RagB/SusD family nutrient uptake outer membrane protein [Winogradskyella psychrotolerans]|uniref:RagB/SusD family nutrient uptake outer membrane protein n=1 Tax=Winogradskyella damuponensis TaxID=943939 RepID=A0ABP8CPI9_9FLAO|nr:RagB/SusD family nutrient uptake outer membrane protein [Winogradskyella psychrotolerans]MBU2922608.1 RagB/SusD family nutrient uptake outer membrane protein [Winogradskyella psychrotolerans]
MKHIKYLIFAVTGFVFISCDTEEFLNPLPDTAIVVEAYYSSDQDVLTGIIGIYDAIQGVNENTDTSYERSNRGVQVEYLLTEHRTDNTRGKTFEGSKADFHRYLIDATNAQSEDYYQSMYQIIFRANDVLTHINVADEANRAKYAAEAKFLRAYAYFNLVRLFGDVPLVTSVVGPEEDQILFTRVAKAQVYEQIVLDLVEAKDVLDNTYKSRASKAAAQGLLAKVYLTQGINYGEAAQLCLDIMGSGFALENNFSDVFYDELNDEIIFAIQYMTGDANESQAFSAEFTTTNSQGREDGLNVVNDNLIADFALYGGNRTEASFKTFVQYSEVIKFLPEGSDITANPPTYGGSPQQAGNDWIILRYADVLLMHAEAILAGGSETTDAAAIDSYMEVRVRAGFDAEADRPSVLTKTALLAERRVELAFENQRFFDLVRFGVADAVLSAHASEMDYPDYNVRQLLLPIPSREINLSGGLLSQNPGY